MLARLLLLLMVACSLIALEGCATTQVTKTAGKKKKRAKKPTSPIVAQAPGTELLEDDALDGDGDDALDDDDADLTAMLVAEGHASFYHDALSGRLTANGEKYNPEAKTCAHKTLPFGTVVVIEDATTRKTTRCRINDRGPFVAGRIIDLSKRVARELGIIDKGVTKVRIRIVPNAAS